MRCGSPDAGAVRTLLLARSLDMVCSCCAGRRSYPAREPRRAAPPRALPAPAARTSRRRGARKARRHGTRWESRTLYDAWRSLLALAADQGKLATLVEKVILEDRQSTGYHPDIRDIVRPAP
jgi:hypothetical protein